MDSWLDAWRSKTCKPVATHPHCVTRDRTAHAEWSIFISAAGGREGSGGVSIEYM